MTSSVLEKSVSQVHHLLCKNAISVQEILELSYTKIQKIQCLNAFITVIPEEVNKMFISKKETKSSLLHGIPYALKDNFSTERIPTTCASVMLKDYIPTFNATVVQKLLTAGGTLIGKTNLDEFAMGSGSIDSIFGAVRNPWQYDYTDENQNDWFIAGGSSGGSAVAVATGASFFSVGSDTGGSVRIPASFCGVVGLKPSYGAISRHGLISLVNSMDAPGIMARNVDDVAFVFNILSGYDKYDSTSVRTNQPPVRLDGAENVDGLVVGIPKEYYAPGLSKEILEAWDKAAGAFSDAGAKVIQVSMPHTQYSIACYHVLCSGEVASNMSRYDGLEYGHRSSGRFTEELYARSRNEGFNATVRGRIMAGNYFLLRDNYETYYNKALRVRRLIYSDFEDVFRQGVNILLTPVTIATAPRYSDFSKKSNRYSSAEHDVYTQPANMSGVPAVSVPVSLSSQTGLPIGLQLMAKNFDEDTLLKAAKFLENASSFPQLRLNF